MKIKIKKHFTFACLVYWWSEVLVLNKERYLRQTIVICFLINACKGRMWNLSLKLALLWEEG